MKKRQKYSIYAAFLLFAAMPTAATWAQKTAVFADADATYERGMSFYEQGLYGKAIEEFDVLLKTPQTGTNRRDEAKRLNAELYHAVAALRLDNADAEKELQAFIYRHSPASVASVARLEIGRYYHQKRQHDKTIQYLSDIPAADLSTKELVEMKFRLGYAHFGKKDFKKAQPLFQQIRGVKGDFYEPSNYYFGVCAYYENNMSAALEAFKLVVGDKKNKYSTVVPLYICQIYFQQKNYKEVIDYGKTVAGNTDLREREQVAKLIGQSYFELRDYAQAATYLAQYVEQSQKVSQEDLYQLAYSQYRVSNYAKAIPTFEQLNTLNSDLGQNAVYNLADCYLKTGNKTAARMAFQRAGSMSFDKNIQEDAFMNYAKLSYELGFDNEAIQALQKVEEKSDYYGEAQNLLSKIFLATRDYETALKTLRAFSPKTPKIKETHQRVAYMRGIQLMRDKQLKPAMTLFDEAMSADGKHQETTALTHFWRADLYYQEEQYAKTVADYEAYLKLASRLPNLPENSQPEIAHYGLGYAYLRQDKHKQAADAFGQCADALAPKVKRLSDDYVADYVYPDALLRAGDCYLYQNNYGKAAGFYRNIIDNNYGNTDYALYQLSLTYQYAPTPQPYEQLALLDKLVKNYPQSLYADDALYSIGYAYFNLRRYDLAQESYAKLIKEYPQSEFVPRALLIQGRIAYNAGRKEEALRLYEAAFRHNPQGEQAQAALADMRAIYAETGNMDGYFAFLGTVSGYTVKEDDRDSIMFDAAQGQYKGREWQNAANSFTAYLQRYPTGNSSQRARFLRGESNFNLKKYSDALPDFRAVSDANNPEFSEVANLRAAEISYHILKNYTDAFSFYTRLDKYATTDENRHTAQFFAMRSAYWGKNWNELPLAVERFLKNTRASQNEKAEAYFFLAKSQQEAKNLAKAKENYQTNIELSGGDVFSAEARYRIAQITYLERDLTKAKDLCFKVNKESPDHIDWVVRAFILLADIYAEEKNLFQAKATLESVVNNYKGEGTDPELAQEARTKLELVKKAEADKSKLK